VSPSLVVAFVGAAAGAWRVERLEAVRGEPLPAPAAMSVLEGDMADAAAVAGERWRLRGVTSEERYATPAERAALAARQPPLGREEATQAALIPVRKSDAWWELGMDARREILEGRSRHIATGLEYLPAVARRLHHCRELGEPFDFLTWFEFAPSAAGAFEELVGRLRATPEWEYVEREVDVRLVRDG
jgi:hypothetical protein